MITTAPPLSARLIVMSLFLFRFLNNVNRDNGSLKLDFNSESLPKSDYFIVIIAQKPGEIC